MKTILEELKESWRQPWPRESLLRPDLVETVPVPETGFEPIGTNVSTNDDKIETVETPIVKRGRGGRSGPRRQNCMGTVDRRRAVLKMMKEHPEMNSMQIAKELGEPRGSVWHAILYIRKVMPELANWGVKAQGRWYNQYSVGVKSVD